MTSMFMVSGEQEIIPDDASIATTEADTPVNGSARRMSYDTNDPSDGRRKQGRVYRLQPAVKQYAWGIRGADSRVARYGVESGSVRAIDQSAPYAELWLGTHPSGPSLLDDGTELGKVAHPDKALAKRLHETRPDVYKDDNHKPEMAIALTPFEAMCGFRRLSEIAVHLRKHPEFAACISTEAQLGVFMASSLDVGGQKRALHGLFESFMACDAATSRAQLEKLVGRLRQQQSCAFRTSGANHINPALSDATPGVPGGPDAAAVTESAWERKAHAYVAGEILECMACSDNVVRAGLTPKHKDVENLVDMLSYTMGGPDIEFGRLVHVGEGTRTLCYTPPVPEFEVLITTVEPGASYEIAPCEVPSILICIEGIGHTVSAPGPDGVEPQRKHQYELCPGKALYVTAGTIALNLATSDGCKGPLKVARARSNLTMLGKSEDA
ncbi:mannose-6-phosphate isomerase [Aureococcus anophagefferens]|nr:mannose-6-phosphate isomerase [Aureococcus anophagefferens]